MRNLLGLLLTVFGSVTVTRTPSLTPTLTPTLTPNPTPTPTPEQLPCPYGFLYNNPGSDAPVKEALRARGVLTLTLTLALAP